MKKKLRLRKEVKEVLVWGLLFIGMVALMIWDNNYTNKAIDQCVKAGHSYSYCESGLR